MQIIEHRLYEDETTAYPFVSSPNKGGRIEPKYLVIHYTAMHDADTAISRLYDPAVGVSAHLLIDRDGNITQMVPFDAGARHAGKSNWEGESNLNGCSIGIELDNAGRLERKNGQWQSWFGKNYDASEVLEATHKNEVDPAGWHVYTPVQIETTLRVARLLVQTLGLGACRELAPSKQESTTYEPSLVCKLLILGCRPLIPDRLLVDVLGHDEISPGRKWDPGPAFPMESFRTQVYKDS